MASWYRVTVDRSCRLSLPCRRWYNSMEYRARTSTGTRSGWAVSSQLPEEAGGALARLRYGVRYMAARFFAAPVQTRTKEEPKGMQERRLNEAITAKFIRLVTDEGHAVMSRDEALDRARRLDLDLVEVQRTAKPPVCKIMDYHKVKYKKEAMEKERAKAKSESTVRKGDVKEVRLEGKIEQKDIEVKAKTVRGLIERGYRVKCMALPSKQRGTEEHDLGALLSRLTDLIEDVMVVESGPFVRNEQAYVVVRHVKFGSRKGSRKKAIKTVETTSGTGRAASTTPISLGSDTIDEEAVEPMDIDEETEDEMLSDQENDAQGLPSNATISPVMFDPGTKRNVDHSSSWAAIMADMTEKSPASKTVHSSMKGKLGSERDQIYGHAPPKPSVSQSEFSTEDTNRYSRRGEMKFRPDQTKPAGRSGTVSEVKRMPESPGFRSPSIADSLQMEQQRSNQGNIPRRPPAYGHVPPKPSVSQSEFSAEDTNRYSRRGEMRFRPDQTKPAGRSGAVSEVKRTPESPGFRSPTIANSLQMDQQRSNQGNIPRQSPAYGNQRRDHLDSNQGQMPPNDSSPAPSYGIFSSPKRSTSGVQRMADANIDKEKSTLTSYGTTPNIPKSKIETTGPNNDKTEQGGWGIFSKPISKPSRDDSFGQR